MPSEDGYSVDIVSLNPESNISVFREQVAVKVTHKDTGLTAQCGIYKSSHKNRRVCMSMIEYGLLESEVNDTDQYNK